MVDRIIIQYTSIPLLSSIAKINIALEIVGRVTNTILLVLVSGTWYSTSKYDFFAVAGAARTVVIHIY